jgi:type I restriction-modification system DNA methylase subunit
MLPSKTYNGLNPPMKEALKQISDLVERFERNIEAYRSPAYNETQLRIEFIDPFFEALGWDVTNKAGYAEQYKDVIHEDAIKIAGATKAPDYCFRIGGVRKFFLETKKPSIDIKTQTSPAYQLRRYAWSAKLPISILTDFEEMAIYDCRLRPKPSDKPSVGRVRSYTYTQYHDSFEEIYNLLSKESVLKGSFDKFAESERQKRGTTEVDGEFLKEIESWREALAKDIALKNPRLTVPELNFAVQLTIDRIIFLRMCEDRGIEHYGQIQNLLNGTNTYRRLREIFYHADDKYNSGLFDFKADRLTPELKVDDRPLKDIFKNLYYPESPYEFSVLGADILGHVYEQFLGKVIRLTEGHRAKVEEKPEVRKAGGVYYTPTYIVDYIVKNTVGKICEGKTTRQISTLRVLDPACGSGSFLLGAYQYLLDYHRDWYQKDGPQKHTKEIYQGHGGQWYLTIQEKKRILLNNIYGVDIDPQAVEVTKLSLLLKVMEGENQDTLERQMRLFRERALPDLGSNIKCGNSLIGPDFYSVGAGLALPLFKEEETYRINAFDWEKEFFEIMKQGGFDAVIGNPPYVDIKSLPEPDVKYIFHKFKFANNRINLFASFIEKALEIIPAKGFLFSMIVPTALLSQESYKALRQWITRNFCIASLVRLPNESFGASTGDVKVDTIIFVFSSKLHKPQKTEIIGYAGHERIFRIDPKTAYIHGFVEQDSWAATNDCVWSLNIPKEQESILKKCEIDAVPLEKCVEFSLGITPYDKYKGHTQNLIHKKIFHASYKKDKTFRKLLAGNDVRRYDIVWNEKLWISYGPWIGAPREQRFFTNKRILVKQIIDWTTKRIWASVTNEELYNAQNAFNLLQNSEYSLEYILGILNSKLITFYHHKRYLDEFKMRFQKILIKDCKRFPIRTINFSDPKDKRRHDKMVELVERMLTLHKQLLVVKTPDDKTRLQRQIDATDHQIDQLVYELYGLTEKEIQIVEGKASNKTTKDEP